ncbi:hypothetical protein NQ015_10570 [Corynebacterium sp. 153RC1]|uniref:hypothetical protein n=1 Tax=unclassified Corynebacterium TaxID=2624378 RepID=UPI00211BE7CB|nr:MULTISPECIES: hypothetical protein [unclassified Corynebacterium]MCQ9353006.1 hypothetical protein [Corynebacterium sp. 209RC1]MCQ9355677.1 hypothetical protein [Corynebacterium sp. 1222RC1]MCQ9357161.1 hypothetical protein [Corynebacterium sp. 122RC1]MCQ9359695.1 hypothetical protein [Corynebacterium sp. 142RC1]MCQ9362192.1 hypothetical protein [Corynebacterium sp. 153RC1]
MQPSFVAIKARDGLLGAASLSPRTWCPSTRDWVPERGAALGASEMLLFELR